MQLSLQNFTTLVQNMSASAQGACADLVDITVGSVTRALLEASASVALWLQFLVLQVMTMSRLATSNGPDVDSWVADFGVSRLPGTAALGHVTLTCLAPQSQSAVVGAGVIVKTSDGMSAFSVIEDTTNAAWSPAANAYVRPAGTASITVQIQALVAGSAGNVEAGTINLLGQAVPGIDTVTNALPLSSGRDQESDASLRLRFVGYINSRSRATVAAVQNAVAGVQQGLTSSVIENVDAAGDQRAGSFTVVFDDGSGAPSASLIAQVAAAVDLVRPVGAIATVRGPTIILANVALDLTIASGADNGGVRANVEAALTQYINGLPVGHALPFTRVANTAYLADQNVLNVTALTVNGSNADIGGGIGEVVRAGTVTVS